MTYALHSPQTFSPKPYPKPIETYEEQAENHAAPVEINPEPVVEKQEAKPETKQDLLSQYSPNFILYYTAARQLRNLKNSDKITIGFQYLLQAACELQTLDNRNEFIFGLKATQQAASELLKLDNPDEITIRLQAIQQSADKLQTLDNQNEITIELQALQQSADELQTLDNPDEITIGLKNALQIIISFVALPLITVTGLFAAAFYALTCNRAQASSTVQKTVTLLSSHALGIIPYSLTEIFTNSMQGMRGIMNSHLPNNAPLTEESSQTSTPDSLLSKPNHEALFKHIERANNCRQEESPDEIQVRLLFTLQIVTSLVALPIIALTGLSEAAFYVITCNGSEALLRLRVTLSLLTTHLLGAIAYSIRAIFIKFTEESHLSFLAKVDKAANFWLPNPDQPNETPSEQNEQTTVDAEQTPAGIPAEPSEQSTQENNRDQS